MAKAIHDTFHLFGVSLIVGWLMFVVAVVFVVLMLFLLFFCCCFLGGGGRDMLV